MTAAGALTAAMLLAAVATPAADEVAVQTLLRRADEADRALQALRSHQDLLVKADDPALFLSLEERRVLLHDWVALLEALERLDSLAHASAGGVFRLGGWRDQAEFSRHLIGVTARGVKLIYGMAALHQLEDSADLAVQLNSAAPELGIASGSYDRLVALVADEMDLGELLRFRSREQLATHRYFQTPTARSVDPQGWLPSFWERNGVAIDRAVTSTAIGGSLLHNSLLRPASRLVQRAVASIVREVALFMGRTRLRRSARGLISLAQVQAVLPELQPGDIVLEKTNFFLCDYAIDGFWGHSALYLGSYDQATAAFDTPEVRAFYRARGYDGWADFVARARAPAVRTWRRPGASDGRVVRVLEGDGVARRTTLTSAEHAFDGDSVAFLRPRGLSPLDRARAVADALAYWDTPYDFGFDTRTDDSMVCTEILAKAYADAPGKRGVQFPVDRLVDGRLMIYPNRIAQTFAREAGAAGRRFDFVTMLRGDMGLGRSVVGDEQDFIDSHTWPEPR